ncbi:MAG TPA: hypothetical protein PK801_14015 [Aggregatilineales bacterium]|nr:hypothetical protein [Chloroflexota bacterium]HOA25613.1 hypothetical protein [Aggregatilineales bacterium]HQA69436.1 hypothetical protein [Aggregatilineales bacterium]
MAKKQTRRHRLLVPYRVGQRWRAMPLLTALLGVLLYALMWLHRYGLIEGMNGPLLDYLWTVRQLILALIGFSLLLYVLIMLIARGSYVEARPGALRVKAGLIPLNISYSRIGAIKLGQVGAQFPADRLSNRDYALLEPLLPLACTVVELTSWPKEPVRKLWHKFLFTPGGDGLLFIVEDAMLLNQQIDAARTALLAASRRHARYQDPIERAIEMQRRAGRG